MNNGDDAVIKVIVTWKERNNLVKHKRVWIGLALSLAVLVVCWMLSLLGANLWAMLQAHLGL